MSARRPRASGAYQLNLRWLFFEAEQTRVGVTMLSQSVPCPTCGAAVGEACGAVWQPSHGRRRAAVPEADRIRAVLAMFERLEQQGATSPYARLMIPRDRDALVARLRLQLARGVSPP